MLEKEIKILWGRSGNRCAICKFELTPDGEKETLGEMAHIVARSADGPRGGSSLTSNQRDKYSNLILLCPTHHAEIDKNFSDWPVTKLLEIKVKHEAWVSEQLNNGNISITAIDNAEFLGNRISAWHELSRDHVAIVLSFTPLRVSDNQLDTMEQDVLNILEKAKLLGDDHIQQVNRYHTRPSEFGLVNEKFPELPDRFGYSFHIFRSGHCEYFQELGSSTDQVTKVSRSKGDDLKGAKYVMRYTDIAEVIDSGLTWLEQLWEKVLPYEYIDFRCMILNTRDTILFSYEDNWKSGVFGHPTKSESLIYKDILSKEHDTSLLTFDVLKWVSNCFGLVLHHKLDSTGKYARPISMR
jgi:hypothetical protein